MSDTECPPDQVALLRERIAELEEELREAKAAAALALTMIEELQTHDAVQIGHVPHEDAEGLELTVMLVRNDLKKLFAKAKAEAAKEVGENA